MQFDHDCRSHLDQSTQRWNQQRQKITQLEEAAKDPSHSNEHKESISQQITQLVTEIQTLLDQLRVQIGAFITSEILSSRNHLSRMEPYAQFVQELAENNPEEAIYALDQFILHEQRRGEKRSCEHSGRMMAALHLKNLHKKIRPDQKAFEKAIVTWAKELADFKIRYQAQEAEFSEISNRHGNADTAWLERSDKMAEEFAAMRGQSELDLKSLKDTYETEMQLKGPLLYWRGKRREHKEQIGKLKNWAIFAAITGLIALCLAAWGLLPENHPAATVPWRQIGFFMLASTFVLWGVKLLVKLLLSHIHLYADAREREVMISTYMALLRRDGLSRDDFAMVLAPIFKPSTTGVIKDDGGPSSLGDFLNHLTAGKN